MVCKIPPPAIYFLFLLFILFLHFLNIKPHICAHIMWNILWESGKFFLKKSWRQIILTKCTQHYCSFAERAIQIVNAHRHPGKNPESQHSKGYSLAWTCSGYRIAHASQPMPVSMLCKNSMLSTQSSFNLRPSGVLSHQVGNVKLSRAGPRCQSLPRHGHSISVF